MEGLPRVLAMAVRPSGFRYVAALFLFFFLLLQYRIDGSGITGLGGLFNSTCESRLVVHFRLGIAGVFNLWSADPLGSAGSFQGVRGQLQKNWRPVAF